MSKIIFILIILAASAFAENDQLSASTFETPGPTAATIFEQAGLGLVTAVGLGFARAFIGSRMENCSDDPVMFCGLGGVLIGGSLGYTVGSTTGIYFGGKTNGRKGSFLATLLGSGVGLFTGGLLSTYTNSLPIGLMILMTGPIAGGLGGYYLTDNVEAKVSIQRGTPTAGIALAGPVGVRTDIRLILLRI